MSADDGHRECPDCLGAVHVLEDVDNPCSAAVDLSRGERLRRANQVHGHAQEGRAERRRSPRRSPRSHKRGHKHTRRHSEDRQYESPRRSDKEETPRPAKRPAPAEAAGGGSAESRHILAVLQALTERLGRLEEQRGPPSLPSGQQGLPLRRPRRTQQVELAAVVNHVRTLESTAVGETPVSSLMSRVLSAANILGLLPPTPDPVPQGGVWDGVSHTSPPPSIPVAEDYTRMLTSSWGRALKRPQFNAGCRQLAMTQLKQGLGTCHQGRRQLPPGHHWALPGCPLTQVAHVWLAQISLPEAIRMELLNLPVVPGHVIHPESQAVLDRTERAAASREAVQRLVTFGTSLFRRHTKAQPEILIPEGDRDRDRVGASMQA
ncbi:unnamed protein product [Arctogadus glacialis]